MVPDHAIDDGIGSVSCTAHALTDVDVPREAGEEPLDDGPFDEEGVAAKCRDASSKHHVLSSRSHQPGSSVCVTQPPTERIIRSQECKVPVEGRVVGEPGVVAGVGPHDIRLGGGFPQTSQELEAEELIICVKAGNDVSLRLANALRSCLLTIASTADDNFEARLRERLAID